MPDARCLNCDALLTGEYCARCGQHVKHHVHSTRELFGELIEDLFHADHRVWRTLRPLMFKPGWLTNEYLRGKRVSYTPPFRLYIVLSLLFFLTASLTDHQASVTVPAETGEATAPAAVPPTVDAEAARLLETFLTRLPGDERAEARTRLYRSFSNMSAEEQRETITQMLNVCSPGNLSKAIPAGLAQNEKLQDVCRSVTADSGEAFAKELWHHVPQMMFFFLPLLALSMKVLYPRRFYAEHVLFLVHFHAFAYLAVALRNTVNWLFSWFSGSWAGVVPALLTTAVVFYLPWYLYRSLRRVYGQGRAITVVKFFLLTCAYFASLMITLLGLTIFTAISLD